MVKYMKKSGFTHWSANCPSSVERRQCQAQCDQTNTPRLSRTGSRLRAAFSIAGTPHWKKRKKSRKPPGCAAGSIVRSSAILFWWLLGEFHRQEFVSRALSLPARCRWIRNTTAPGVPST